MNLNQHGSYNIEKAPDIEYHESYNWADAAIASMEENFLTISSAVVHVYGQGNFEVASGQFSIVRTMFIITSQHRDREDPSTT